MIRSALLAAALLGLCATAWAKPDVPEDEDPFILQVDIGRQAVFIERALNALGDELPIVRADGPEDPQRADALWRSLRETGREGAILKALYCARRLVPAADCRRARPPAWISADPEPLPSLPALRAHLDELVVFIDPFVRRGCELGRRARKDELYCSVE